MKGIMNETQQVKRKPRGLWILILITSLITLAVGPVFAASKTGQKGSGDVVARWEQSVLTKEDVELRIGFYPPDVQEELKDPRQRKQFIESLLQVLIVSEAAREAGLDKSKAIQARIADSTNNILTREYFEQKLASVKSPTDAEALAFYKANQSDYATPVFVHAQHILVNARPDSQPDALKQAEEKARKVYKEVTAGGDFDKLAAKYSDDADTKEHGGDLGVFQFDQMVPEFSEPVFKMKKGEVSKPLKTPFGFHIVRVKDVLPSKQMSYEEVKEDIIERMDNQNREKVVFSELDRLMEKYKVKIY